MKLDLLTDFDDLPEVTSSKIYLNNKFHPQGLFSEQIFGPVKSYQCQCKVTTSSVGEICPHCGVRIISSALRRKQFARIKLGRFIHPAIWLMITSNKSLNTVAQEFLNFSKCLTKDLKIEEFSEDELPDDGYLGLDAIKKFFDILGQKKSGKSKIIDYIHNAITNDKFFVDSIIIIPPDLRPALENRVMDEINKLYISLLDYKEKGATVQTYFGKLRYESEIQRIVGDVSDFVLSKLGSKNGLLRNKLEGKRVDFSGRAVISVDPSIPITHCKVSRYILLELYKLDIAKELTTTQKKFVTFKSALDYLQDQIDNEEILPETKKLLDNVATNDVIILNRQPTLHRGSMISFRVIPDDSFVISINPLVCPAFNADFDGDQMAIYRPLQPLARKEAQAMLPSRNYLDPANATLHFAPKQDIVYGIYKLSKLKSGRKLISKALGLDYELTTEVNSKTLTKLLEKQVGKDYTVFDKIKDLGFAYTMKKPTTMSVIDFETAKVNLTGDTSKDYDLLKEKEDYIKKHFALTDIINSGARASWDQAKQLLVARGYVSDFFGKIVPYPISHSLADGLSSEEFFVSSYGTRKGLLDVAENTAESGYLTRRLVYSSISAYVDRHTQDCGTKRTIRIEIEDEKHAKTFLYRYYYETDPLKDENAELLNVSESNYKDIIGKTIYVRSPLMCKNPFICKTCYGGLADKLNTDHAGIMAAQSLGERSTQLVLRTFHTSGVAQGKNLDKQEDIVSALQSLERIIDRPIKIKDEQQIPDILYKIYSIYKDYGDIHHIHYEVILAQKHRLENGKRWRLSGLPIENSKIFSLRQVPATESWFLGIIFSNIRNIVNGLFSNSEKLSVLEKIALGEL